MINKFHNIIPIIFLLLYLSILHIFLPQFNDRKDFFIFSSWRLFSYGAETEIYDLSWDGGKTFLFRDLRKKAKVEGVDVKLLFYFVTKKNIKAIRTHKALLKWGGAARGHCDLFLFELKGSRYEHFFLKKRLDVISQSRVCND